MKIAIWPKSVSATESPLALNHRDLSIDLDKHLLPSCECQYLWSKDVSADHRLPQLDVVAVGEALMPHLEIVDFEKVVAVEELCSVVRLHRCERYKEGCLLSIQSSSISGMHKNWKLHNLKIAPMTEQKKNHLPRTSQDVCPNNNWQLYQPSAKPMPLLWIHYGIEHRLF